MAEAYKIDARGIEEIDDFIKALPKTAPRALERAIDGTAKEIKQEVRGRMTRVFDRPTRWTLNALQLTPTYKHNMMARVWFKDPVRMREHYLVPQVEGGRRQLKGFERALDNTMMVPGRGARIDGHGNVSTGQIRQLLSVLGRAERAAGSTQNKTKRSSRRNPLRRDYIYLPRGSGKLPPGVYERVARTHRMISKKRSRALGIKGDKAYEYGKKKNKFQRLAMARGLQAIVVKGRQRAAVKPLLRFYHIADQVYAREFRRKFDYYLDKELTK